MPIEHFCSIFDEQGSYHVLPWECELYLAYACIQNQTYSCHVGFPEEAKDYSFELGKSNSHVYQSNFEPIEHWESGLPVATIYC